MSLAAHARCRTVHKAATAASATALSAREPPRTPCAPTTSSSAMSGIRIPPAKTSTRLRPDSAWCAPCRCNPRAAGLPGCAPSNPAWATRSTSASTTGDVAGPLDTVHLTDARINDPASIGDPVRVAHEDHVRCLTARTPFDGYAELVKGGPVPGAVAAVGRKLPLPARPGRAPGGVVVLQMLAPLLRQRSGRRPYGEDLGTPLLDQGHFSDGGPLVFSQRPTL